MKGMELPINVMVIVVICVIVLLAVVALFFGVWNPFKTTATLETAKNNACQMLVSMGCPSNPESISVRDFDANRNGTVNDDGTGTISWDSNHDCYSAAATNNIGDNLASLCVCYYNLKGTTGPTDCEKLCGCGT